MGFQIQNKKGLISEINVTPFIDVMLVLLIIFMITAPLMLSGLDLKLPKTKEVNKLQLNSSQILLSLTAAGEYYLGREKILPNELAEELLARMKSTSQKTIYIRADENLAYGKVAKVMSILKSQGLSQIALVTEIAK